METRRLGRTEHHSSVAVLGGAAFLASDPATAEAPFHDALGRGVNHLDIAPRYGNAELAIGPHVPAVRDRLFIGEKTARTDPDGVRAQLEESLRRLGCDHFDLYQVHGVTDLDDLDRRGPAFDAILRARDEGSCRHVGVTGHDLGAPAAHLEAVRRYDLDTVMFPIYPRLWADATYRADAEALLEHCRRHDLGVHVIKAAARRPWGDREPTATSWYEPVSGREHLVRGVRFALSTPGVTALCTPGDLDLLPVVLDVVEEAEAMSDDERAAATAAMADEALIFPLLEHARR